MKTGEMFTIQMTDAMDLTTPYEKGTATVRQQVEAMHHGRMATAGIIMTTISE
jgi:hypothetical protein